MPAEEPVGPEAGGDAPTGSDPVAYGDRWAGIYDERVAWRAGDVEPVVDLLADLAGDGPALELGVGTGRVALPLADRGVEVHGLEASPAMVERLRAKPSGADLPVTVGDMADMDVEGSFRLVFAVFSTLFALPSQEAQVRCFNGVARHLAPDGAFVVEAFVPDPARFEGGQTVRAVEAGPERVVLEVSRHDPVRQRVATTEVTLAGESRDLRPLTLRYAWPAELDLMARLAGLRREARWADWRGGPFTGASHRHVSVYRPEAGA